MKILRKYIIKEFIYYFLICFSSFVLIAVLFSILTELDVLEKENGPKLFIEAVLAGIPLLMEITIPISVLLATNLTFISLNKSLEITAMTTAGVSYFQMLLPLFKAGLIISLFSYFNQSYLTVWWNADKHLSGASRVSQDSWHFQKGKLVFLSQISPRRNQIVRAKIFSFDSEGKISAVENLEDLKLEKSGWNIRKQEKIEFTDDRILRDRSVARKFDLGISAKKITHPKYLNFSDLIAEIKLKREKAINYDNEISALYQKISALFSVWVMILLGLPFSLYSGTTANFRAGILLSITTGFIFWLSDQILLSLSSSGLIIIEIAAFGANLIFSMIGFALIHFQRTGRIFPWHWLTRRVENNLITRSDNVSSG